MKQLFNQIWQERDHVSYLTGKPLLPEGHPKFYWQFAHILGKNTAPSWKKNKENIILILPEEHEKQEQYPEFIELRKKMRIEYNREKYPKRFENQKPKQ